MALSSDPVSLSQTNQRLVCLQSLEKINRHHELQLKLSEAKRQQADALLTEAQEKHKREKEYVSPPSPPEAERRPLTSGGGQNRDPYIQPNPGIPSE